MWTLALETASQHGSLALFERDRCVACEGLEGRAYAATLIPAIERLLRTQGLGPAQLDLLAVADGPGSFTGIRIGLATVKALMETNHTPAIAVGTLEAVAGASEDKHTLAVMDAGRNMVYVRRDGVEEEEAAEALGPALDQWKGKGVTPDAALAARWPVLEAIEPRLAPTVGRLALVRWRQQPGATNDVLTLDARYLGARWGT